MTLAIVLICSCLAQNPLSAAERQELETLIERHSLGMQLEVSPHGIPFHFLNVPERVDELFEKSPVTVLDICIAKCEKGNPKEALVAAAFGFAAGRSKVGVDQFAFMSDKEFVTSRLQKSGLTLKEHYLQELKDRREQALESK